MMLSFYKVSGLLIVLSFVVFSAHAASLNPKDFKTLAKETPQKYDSSLMISPATIMQKLKQKERLFLVDIRHEKEFSAFKIPGSINIPLSFIKTKQFLKTKPVILIHRAMAYSEIISRVNELKKKGFNIKILQGGLWAWKHKGGVLVGDPFLPDNLNKISAKTFFMEKDNEEWMIFNACSKPSKNQLKLIPHAIDTSQSKNKIPQLVQSLFSGKAVLKKQTKIAKNNPLMAVIIFNETGKDYESLEHQINKAYGHKIFYLKGGLEAYQKFLNYKMLASKPKSERTKKIGQCEPCNEKDNQ
ncbi:MAG: rhodanese-like domain-containing protein [Desulfobacula sp.]|nr:rhodanese-like domain-containing protein [Desulfobacula sp.]